MAEEATVSEYISQRQLELDAERTEIVNKIAALNAQLRDIDAVKRRMKGWPDPTAKPVESQEEQTPGLRATVMAVVSEMAEFGPDDLIRAVTQRLIGANPDSIRAELSKAKDRGLATLLSTGRYMGGKSVNANSVNQAIGSGTATGIPPAPPKPAQELPLTVSSQGDQPQPEVKI